MSVQALRDAFRAGWNIGKSSGGGPDAAFDQWYQDALEYLDRAALPPASTVSTQAICPDKSHDYRVDDSDGLLKCITCKKVLF